MNTTNSDLSFGRIHCVSGGKQFLERNLNKTQRAELYKLIQSQKDNPVNITLAQYTNKRLCGWTTFEEKINGEYHRKDYTQRLLIDSPIKFIKRLCKKADELKNKFQDNINEIGTKDFELSI